MAGLVWLSFTAPNFEYIFQFPWIQISVLAILIVVIGYFAAQKPIYDAVQESPLSVMNPDVGTRVRNVGYLDSFGLSFRIATKGTGRRVKGSRRTILTLFLSFTLASVLWIGGGVVETTMQSYVVRSMGSNVVAVGNPDLLEQYYSAYSLSGTPIDESFHYTNSSCIIPASLITQIEELSGIHHTEQRLLDYVSASENSRAIWNPQPTPDEPYGHYERIGSERVASVLVVGVDFENTFSDWYFEGTEVNATHDAWLGGQMAISMFDDPLIQSVGLMGASFSIKAIAFEIANGGMTALVPLSTLMALNGVSGGNILLVQLDSYDAAVIASIESLASDAGLGIYSQQDVLEENLQAINAYWVLMQPVTILALLSAFLSLVYYLLISVFGRFRDFVIMRSVGAKPIFIVKTMIAEGLDIGIKAGIPAVLVSIFFSVYLLVPEAAVTSIAYLPLSAIVVLIALFAVVVLSTIPVYIIFSSRADLRVSEFAV
jgi:hypothetical protein